MIRMEKKGRGRPKIGDRVKVTIPVDRRTLQIFRATGDGYQQRMNAVLGAAATALELGKKPEKVSEDDLPGFG